MKKGLLLCASALVALTLTGCGETSVVSSSSTAPSSSAVANKTYKIGLGSVVAVSTVTDSTVLKEVDITVAAVIFDSSDKIVSTYIDVIQTPLTYTAAEGETAASLVYTATNKAVKDAGDKIVESKKELGTRYGMSPAKVEWDVQAADYENWTVGKTLAQVAAGTDTTGYGTSEVQATGATIHVSGFSAAIADAATRVKTYTAAEAGVAGVGIIANAIGTSASGFTVTTTIAAASSSADNKVNQDILDEYQVPVSLDGSLNAAATQVKDAGASVVESKKDLGTRYGMSAIGKVEWDVQAKDLENWAIGKTSAQVLAGIGDDGKGTSDVIATGATIHVSGLINAVAEAMAHTK